MEAYELQMLEGMRAFFSGDTVNCFLGTEDEWQNLWTLCAEQKVAPMVLDVLAPAAIKRGAAPESLSAARSHALQSTVGQIQKTHAFLSLYKELCQHGLKPLVVKGLVCRTLYPKPDLRHSSDEDLLVREDALPAVLEFFRQKGLTIENEDDEQVITCLDKQTGVYLELHRTLFSSSSQAYGALNRHFEEAFADAISVDVEDHKVYTLSHSDHAAYLILHSFKHFLHSGFGIRQVCDVCRFVQVYGQEIEWERVSRVLDAACADVFAANLLEIGRCYLGLDQFSENVQKWLETRKEWLDCEDLLADLLSGGIYGNNSQARLHSSRITLNAVAGEKQMGRLLRTIFPPGKDLAGTYPYLRRHAWLLPIAWGARIVSYARSDGGAEAKVSVDIGEHRVALMKKYRVIR